MAQDNAGDSALLREVRRGDAFGLRFELARGGDPNQRDPRGLTPLHLAVAAGQLECCRALIAAGARLEAEDPAGDTPLHYAVGADRVELVDLLIKHGADPRHLNRARQRPVDLGSLRARRHLLPGVLDITGGFPAAR